MSLLNNNGQSRMVTDDLRDTTAHRIKLQFGKLFVSVHPHTHHLYINAPHEPNGREWGLGNTGGGYNMDSIDKLPQWLQDRLAVLNMIQPSTAVDGVGVRLFRHTFWIFGDGEINTTGEKEWLHQLMR